MPIYRYECEACGRGQDAYRTIEGRHDCPRCEKCGGHTARKITPTMVSVFTPYRTVAHDKETGKTMTIRTQAEHRAFLQRNGYEEVGTDRSMAPLQQEEIAHRRAQQQTESAEYEFDPITHEAELPNDRRQSS